MAFVGTSVDMPAECFFQDDDMPPDCPPHGVGLIRRYVPGRRNNTPYYDILVTHAQWPLDNPGVPTAFECRADDVYVRLDDEGFLVVPCADAQNHDDGPRQSSGRRTGSVGKTNEVVDDSDTLDDRDTWFGEAGGDATKRQ
jgi:hypothetical protein